MIKKNNREKAPSTLTATNSPNKSSTTNFTYDLGVFIGRFSPFHEGHRQCIHSALQKCREVIVFVGSHNSARRFDILPFTTEERKKMILDSLSDEDKKRVIVVGIEDLHNNTLWVNEITKRTYEIAENIGYVDPKITLVGHSKDQSSFYLRLFPNWDNIEVANFNKLSATPLRSIYFSSECDFVFDLGEDILPDGTKNFLKEFKTTKYYADLMEERNWIEEYKNQWKNVPYEVIFQTVDNVVIHGSNILMVKRGGYPGKGLWALPGGFLDAAKKERVIAASLRELYEETRISLPRAFLEGRIKGDPILFDDPNRSSRGRTMTHAVVYDITPTSPVREQGESLEEFKKRRDKIMKLPKIRAADDAKRATWFRFDDIERNQTFEDHYHIIQVAMNRIEKNNG